MTVAELLGRISSRELTEWMAFGQLEPFGRRAEYTGHAVVASTIANVNRGKDQEPYEIEDFIPKRAKKKEDQTEAQMIAMAAMWTTAYGGKDKRKDKN
jgi:hypothetical protein